MAETWARHPAVLWRQTAESVVLMRDGDDDTVVLDGSGARLWATLVDGLPTEDIVDRLADEYQADPRQVAEDLVPALQDLQRRGLVVREER